MVAITKCGKYSYTVVAGGAQWSVRFVGVPGGAGPGLWRASTGDAPYVDDDRRVQCAATLRGLWAALLALDADYRDSVPEAQG